MANLSHGQIAPRALQGSALDRIDHAIARIEAAAATRAAISAALTHRHETLRTSMAEAIAALDAVIARSDPSDMDPNDLGQP